MEVLEALLLKSTPNSKKASKNNNDFLIELLNSSEKKDLKNILTTFKKEIKLLSKEDIQKLTPKIQQEIKNLLPKKEEKKEFPIKIENSNTENPTNIEITTPLLNTPIQNITKEELTKLKSKISKMPEFQILSEKEIKEFKKIDNIKDLIKFANEKLNLNIEKLKITNPKKSPLPQTNTSLQTNPLPPKKIEIPLKNKFQINTNNKESITLSQEKKESSISLKDLISPIKKEEKKETQTPSTPQNQISLITQELKQNIIKAKETIKNFSSKLKEAITEYKPPITKIELELNPRELGKVAVNIVKKGKNLEVTINSNNNAIQIFHLNQQELKQNLTNLGFNNINMSFNSNQENQKQNQEYKKYSKKESLQEEEELVIEIKNFYA